MDNNINLKVVAEVIQKSIKISGGNIVKTYMYMYIH